MQMSEEVLDSNTNNCINVNDNQNTTEEEEHNKEDNISAEVCRPMDSHKTVEPIGRSVDLFLDRTSKSLSSKSSIKSNSSDGRHSAKSEKSKKSIYSSVQTSIQRRVLPIKDTFCWDCHKEGVDFSCTTCLRSYHQKCFSFKKAFGGQSADGQDLCPECLDITKAEEESNPSFCMQWLDGNTSALSQLLDFTIMTVRAADRNDSFSKPVSEDDYPEYRNFIVNPMDLSLIADNIQNKIYGSTNSFLADIKWIQHNCFVFNSGVNNRLISDVKNIIRVAKQECEEIEICPDCYRNYYSLEEDNYFSAVCRRPHAIVWAKLKGHPFWPAKVVRYNAVKNEVDVRFFGTHDKCWLRPEKCYLMSRSYPNANKPAKFDSKKFDEAVRDMNSHLDALERQHKGLFQFHDYHTIFTPDRLYLTTEAIESNLELELNSMEKPLNNKVLNTYNGIAIKNLKVKTSKFDIKDHMNTSDDGSHGSKKGIKRKLNESNSLKLKSKCFTKSIAVRQELSSSVESDVSLMDSKSEIEPSISSNHSFDGNPIINGFDENVSQIGSQEMETTNTSISKPKLSPELKKSKVPSNGLKTSKMKTKTSFSLDSQQNTNNLFVDTNNHLSTISPFSGFNANKTNDNSTEKSISTTDESLKTRVKTLEFKLRKSEDEKNELIRDLNSSKEEVEDMKKTIEELKNSIIDIKRKQWCTNCLTEAILPCCWNTCYCTVDCQHKHWPIHSKSCRRRQQHSNRS